MAVYSCRNCSNLKTRVITKESLKGFKREKIRQALDIRDTESLGLDFPFNLTVYKRINKDGECKIIYCSEHMLNRDLYIYRENLDLYSLSQDKNKPCIKYK
jgi:hypothetical protein